MERCTSRYRRLALRWHPDKQTSAEERPRAELEFKLIAEAYACLRDPQARALYDQQRAANRDDEEVEVEAWPDEAAAADSRHRRTSRHGTSHHRHQHDRPRSNRDTVSPFDLFRELFGGPAFGGGAGPSFGTSLFDTFGQSPFESMSPFNNVRDLPFDIDSQFGALEDSLFGAPRDFPFGTPSWNLFGGNGRTHALPRDNGNPFRPLLRGHGVNIGSGSNASSVITQIINGMCDIIWDSTVC